MILAAALCWILQNSPAPIFAGATPAANFTWANALADVNGDGNTDSLYIDYSRNLAGVLRGDGKGAFFNEANFNVGTEPVALTVVDVNQDGILDLEIIHNSANDERIYLGAGDGTFSYLNTYYLGGFPRGMAAADCNQDGIIDFAIAKRGTGTIQILDGLGAGVFAAGAQLPAGSAPFSVAIADINNDSLPDIAAADGGGSNVFVYLASPSGIYPPPLMYPVGLSPASLAFGDINGDFFLDIITANFNSNDVSILPGDGVGGFASPISIPAGTNPIYVAAGDLNGDNIAEAVVANYNSKDLTLVRGVPYSCTQIPSFDVQPSCVAMADINKDGRLDFVYSTYGHHLVPVYDIQLTGALQRTPAGALCFDLHVADVTKDGRPDVLTICSQPKQVYLYSGNAAGGVSNPVQFNTVASPRAFAVVDTNLDTNPDILFGTNGAQFGVMTATTPGSFAPPLLYSAGFGSSQTPAVGDMNSDGLEDVVFASGPSFKYFTTYFASPSGFVTPGVNTNVGLLASVSFVADTNNDGRLDVVTLSGPASYMDIHIGDGAGNFTNFYWYSVPVSPSFGTAADLTQDGLVDILLGAQTGYYFYKSTSPGIWASPVALSNGGGDVSGGITTIDLDGDGLTDLTSLSSMGNGYNYISVRRGTGGGNFSAAERCPTIGSHGGAGDFNLDGLQDFAVDYSNLGISIHWNQSGVLTPAEGTVTFGKGTPGCLGTLGLRANMPPASNSANFGVICSNAPASSLGLCIITDSVDAAGSDLFSLGILWHVDFFLASEIIALNFLSDAGGVGFAPAPIPNNPSVVGNKYYAQGIWAQDAANGRACGGAFAHLVSSSGLEMVIQP